MGDMHTQLTPDDWEELGLIADDLDNAAHAAVLPIAIGIHIAGLRNSVENARDKIREFCRARGFDPWGDA